jgi:YD repeat-containing protein
MYVVNRLDGGIQITMDFRQLLRRAVTATPGSEYKVTRYTPATVFDGIGDLNNRTMDVLYPDDTRAHYEFKTAQSDAGQEVMQQVSSADGVPLRTVQKEYTRFGGEGYAIPWRITTTLDDGQQSKVEYTYDTYTYYIPGDPVQRTAYVDNPIQTLEYDYGLAKVLRKTVNSWLKVNPVNSVDYRYGTENSLGIHIWNRKLSEEVRDGNNNLFAWTRYEYDNYSYPQFCSAREASNAGQHEARAYSGNVTKVERWRDTDGTWLKTLNAYDDAGNVLKTRDPGLHDTSFDFADNWANSACQTAQPAKAYVKTVTNAKGHTAVNAYKSCTGSLASSIDQNERPTVFTYDGLDRLVTVEMPGGRRIDKDYDNANRIIKTKELQNSSGNYVTTRAHFDGLGRASRQELCEDGPACAQSIKTDTGYDALDRKDCVTNPYRQPLGDSNCHDADLDKTWYDYDALGRVIQVTPPDGDRQGANVVLTTYSGNITTAKDQAGKERKTITDALGRLIQVDEPGVQQ